MHFVMRNVITGIVNQMVDKTHGVTRDLIIKYLSRFKEATLYDLAEYVERTTGTVRYHLYQLQDMIDIEYTKRKMIVRLAK